MSTSTEFEIKVSEGKFELSKDLPDGIYRRVKEVGTPTVSDQEKVFVRIPVSELSINDPWFKDHKPITEKEKSVKKSIKIAIEKGLKDFWRPKYDPSFLDEEHTTICYLPGKEPATEESYDWWKKNAKRFLPECKSRLGTDDEYFLFIAVLIKKLIASGWGIEEAWDAVCNDSKKLGYYMQKPISVMERRYSYEKTGCREICGFYDLANTCKILAKNEESYWLASGIVKSSQPLADIGNSTDCPAGINEGTGWIVIEENPYTKLMSTSTESEIKVLERKIELPKDLQDGIYRRVIEKVFVRIPVSELSIYEPWFREHNPITEREEYTKKLIKTAIEKDLKDFWCPKYDPSFSDEKHTTICYLPGKKPAIGKEIIWWKKNAEYFLPECKSRLGTVDEYFLFIALLIKKLVASGWSIELAWNEVCNDSKILGHYRNSLNAKEPIAEDTGCREICGFYDLANVQKILKDNKSYNEYWLVSGKYICSSYDQPLVELKKHHPDYYDYNPLEELPECQIFNRDCISSTGWIVLEKDPYTTK